MCIRDSLSKDDLERLKLAVREAIKNNHITRYHRTWLPFVVYAAEMGYGLSLIHISEPTRPY
mgnify:CR=1 FL=1